MRNLYSAGTPVDPRQGCKPLTTFVIFYGSAEIGSIVA
jgi:hypothetical protein